MRYDPIDPQLFVSNRQRLYTLLKPKSMVVLNANDVLPTNADGSMVFKQNTDLFHLTGVDQEETILVLFPDHPDEKFREVLFLRETSDLIAVWEGEKLTKIQAQTRTGIERVHWLGQFETIFRQMVFEADHIYLNQNEHTRNDSQTQTREARFVNHFKEKYPLHRLERLAPLMHQVRALKQPQEVALLQRAVDITKDGFVRVLKMVKPGVAEYEIEAEFVHEFLRQRSKGFAYTPIIASGKNACVLHYIENNKICQDGDVLLLDVAAEYANYNADLTRSIPVNGRFTTRQRAVYDAVLRVMKAATAMLVVGNVWDEYHKEVGKIMESELLGLGLISTQDISNQDPDWPAYKKYFMHGTSHFLGLDVHDVGNKYRRFEAGMVFTCEPGIYIREEGLGIRLEDDILITESGNVNLMAHIPVEAEEIEDIMNSR
ncbi:MAG: aminopeptidase P family protein [Cytophagia bacterium]|nr:MAG: aminopeptidase P family protein [Runella sp.]TAG19838.1 MAG: aminopeptidase P family protein [Cytophagales bacterium]TAG39081.1 MAG: aminopeptidase P family protein [Cytophagia bacterium]TAG72296.1 MAG: aminopeptidase P family protein [Runella slithyformis]TAG80728.1 MAG: aminopeptidase P family protein [Cytophagales bacterium]